MIDRVLHPTTIEPTARARPQSVGANHYDQPPSGDGSYGVNRRRL